MIKILFPDLCSQYFPFKKRKDLSTKIRKSNSNNLYFGYLAYFRFKIDP